MERRNAIAVVGIVALVIFIGYFAIRGGAIPTPGTKYLNVRATSGVNCGLAWMCWFNNEIQLEYSPDFKYSIFDPKTMQWFCGPGGKPTPLKATLTVKNPDGSVSEYHKEDSACKSTDITFAWNIPLNKGTGLYSATVEVCGSDYWHRWSCKADSFTYTFMG